MIKKLKQIFTSFGDRGGLHIFFSTIFLKVVQFVLGILIIRLLTKEDYGNLGYAFSITQLIIPFSGAGLYLSLLHFGGIQKNDLNKDKLFVHTIQHGFLYSLLLFSILFFLSSILSSRMPGAVIYLKIFSVYLISYYMFYSVISLLRIKKWNRSYAAGLFVNSLFVFVLSLLGIFIADGKGYALGFVSAPALTAVVILSVLRYKRKASFGIFRIARDLPVKMSDYAKYGVYAGLGNIASQMAWQLDTIMIGAILAQSAEVAVYKAATLIPFSLIFIPSVFMQTDFVYIAERYKNKNYLLNYYKKYLLVFVLIVIAILAIWYAAGGLIVRIFGPEYIEARPLINVLMINVASTFLFRVPLGNILAAVGRAKWNSWSATVLLVVNFFLNYMLIPKFGVFGAAYATVTSISLSSLINIVLFAVYLKQIDKKVKQR